MIITWLVNFAILFAFFIAGSRLAYGSWPWEREKTWLHTRDIVEDYWRENP